MSEKSETIAEKMARLKELTAWFESDEFELEVALERFSEAEKLAKEIEAELDSVKSKITILKKDFSAEE